MNSVENSLLGQSLQAYPSTYDRSILFPIPRQQGRDSLDLEEHRICFYGADIWNAWEISWLNLKGKPCVAIGTFRVPCETPHLIESKSLKLYLNSLNDSRYPSRDYVQRLIADDLTAMAGAAVEVRLADLNDYMTPWEPFAGESLDSLDIEVEDFVYSEEVLALASTEQVVSEVLTSDLLKSNCPVTSQPDWGSLRISYTGKQLDRTALLRYILSFRNHNEFHEQCVERIFSVLWRRFSPQDLQVEARYTRRGGLDINPIRSSHPLPAWANIRTVRQ
ncbi:MAG: NADPH-dependent 7-cyano-7-deazaguanine reductase QueF [Zetaproteobacteria bacterium]|nr:NADPH-dependent 7-cyano-7-deazaguanine reductase QueF [Zetaproteobacteria bacterium]